MNSDYRAMRQAAAKRQLRNNIIPQFEYRNNLDEFDHEEECRPDYAFPFCYDEFDVDADHSNESKSTGRGRLLRQSLSTQALLGGTQFRSSENDDISKSVMSCLEESSAKNVWKLSFYSNLSREERDERMRQAFGRAVFVQDLLASTLLPDKW